MSTITRDIISKQFSGYDLVTKKKFTRADLISKIDLWKYILKTNCGAKKYESILIGLVTVNLDYMAICFAAAELSLKIIIVDYSRSDEFKDVNYFDPKTKLLSPIDIFLHDINPNDLDTCSKHAFFVSCANRSFNIHKDIKYSIDIGEFEKIKKIFPENNDILMRCTSSGTTGTPKVIEHTHGFLSEISIRNSLKFRGKCLHIKNLNHGSSLAVFLLPSVISENVNTHLFYPVDEDDPYDEFVTAISKYSDLDYLLFPYPFMIDKFIKESKQQNLSWKNLKIQTLSYIQEGIKNEIKSGNIKSITSIFGSNETSGPVFEITIDKDNLEQSSSYFKKIDDFFEISLKEGGVLDVYIPMYNKHIFTNDIFQQEGEYFVHKGRNDIIKVDGEAIDVSVINKLNADSDNVYLVADTVNNCMYLAHWNVKDSFLEEKINIFLKQKYSRLKIDKSAVLAKSAFLSGIKLDNELLREYFRKYV